MRNPQQKTFFWTENLKLDFEEKTLYHGCHLILVNALCVAHRFNLFLREWIWV